MKENVKRTLTPKLRFPEFTEEWRPTTIGEVFNSDDKPVQATRFESDKILTVKLHANGVVRNERTGALTGGTNYFIRRSGQFIFSKIDLLNGAFGIVPKQFDGFYSSSDVPAFSFGTEHSPTFFLNWLTIRYRRLDIERTGTSATLKRVSPEKFWELPILLPTLPEQQKIADCLRSLDGLIAAEGRKLEALRDHKRGLMQQLFPQPGQTQPRLRFPKFRDKGEWTSEKLGRICKFVRGPFGGALKKEIFVPAGYAVYEQSHAIHKDLDTFRYYIDEIKYNELKRFSVKPNDIIMSCSGTMGKFAVLSSKPTPGVINQALLKLSVDNKYDLGFIAIALELPGNQSRLLAQSAGGAIKNVVGVKLLKEIEINVPAKQEQSRIAACLSALDAQIAAQSSKIESLKLHKRGLMQQLFPAPQEVET